MATSAEQGDASAVIKLAHVLDDLGNRPEAFLFYQRAAEQFKDLDAMNNLGLLHAERGDDRSAEVWWENASLHGHVETMNNLGVLLINHRRTQEAGRWLKLAASRGSEVAQRNLDRLRNEL